jgi:hypothetical protein
MLCLCLSIYTTHGHAAAVGKTWEIEDTFNCSDNELRSITLTLFIPFLKERERERCVKVGKFILPKKERMCYKYIHTRTCIQSYYNMHRYLNKSDPG